MIASAEPPPSPPLNLTFSTLSSVTISWVAPLDTPLCVHIYTVTFRNSLQVMVYNTTDNRSSLNITDLTLDGEYSVTVAGRDGAGRLGQESEELNITLKGIICVSFLIVPATCISKQIFVQLQQNYLKLITKFQIQSHYTLSQLECQLPAI